MSLKCTCNQSKQTAYTKAVDDILELSEPLERLMRAVRILKRVDYSLLVEVDDFLKKFDVETFKKRIRTIEHALIATRKEFVKADKNFKYGEKRI